MTTALLKIDNCLDCPHSKEIQDPSSGDSFDWNDVSLCCTKTPLSRPEKTDRGEVVPGRRIIAYERVIRRSEAAVPTWCPLAERVSKGHQHSFDGVDDRCACGEVRPQS